MYKIQASDGFSALIDEPVYIRKHPNGSFVLAKLAEAEGIAANGTVYSILDHKLEGYDHIDVFDEVTASSIMDEFMQLSSILWSNAIASNQIDDTTISEHLSILPTWVPQFDYTTNVVVSYEGKAYRCVQGHKSQDNWTPDSSASLWSLIADPTVEFPEWSQPLGSFDAYSKGDKVSYQGQHCISTVYNNVWVPGVYGWNIVNEETNEL